MLAELTAALLLPRRRAPGRSSSEPSRGWGPGRRVTTSPSCRPTAPIRSPGRIPLEHFLRTVREAPFPVIAAVEGGVWGGACDFVLTCDLVVAVRTSTFAITPARLGIPYNTAGVAHFLGALPLNVAKEMFFTAEPITAEQAEEYGVVNRLAGDATRWRRQHSALAHRIASLAPLAITAIKAEMTALTDARGTDERRVRAAHVTASRAWSSEDYQEGIRAFTGEAEPPVRGQVAGSRQRRRRSKPMGLVDDLDGLRTQARPRDGSSDGRRTAGRCHREGRHAHTPGRRTDRSGR